MNKIIILFLTVLTSVASAQVLPIYTDLHILPSRSQSLKNFEDFELADLLIYNGEKKEAKYLYIVDMETGNRIYELDERDSRARRFRLSFFGDEIAAIPKVICVSLEGDYSWGTHILLVEGNKIYDAGFLSYGVDNFNFAAIGLYAQFELHDDWLLMYFQEDAKLINYATDELIEGSAIEFKITRSGITRFK